MSIARRPRASALTPPNNPMHGEGSVQTEQETSRAKRSRRAAVARLRKDIFGNIVGFILHCLILLATLGQIERRFLK